LIGLSSSLASQFSSSGDTSLSDGTVLHAVNENFDFEHTPDIPLADVRLVLFNPV